MALGLATGLLFRGVPDTLAGMQNRAGSLFFTLTFFAFGSIRLTSSRTAITVSLSGSSMKTCHGLNLSISSPLSWIAASSGSK